MTKKADLQKELLEKVKPGTKPSQLKRSKSADAIPLPPPAPDLVRSKSNETFSDPKYPYTTLISQAEELEKLSKESEAKSTTIALLRKKNEELEAQLKKNPPPQLLHDQLKEKQKELEELRAEKELQSRFNSLKNSEPSETSAELDQSLFARHKSLKDWFSQYEKNKKLDQELVENIEEASTELIKQDKKIVQLQQQILRLNREKGSLQKDLQLVSRLAEIRKVPWPSDYPTDLDYLKYILYSCLAVWFVLVLVRNWPEKENEVN